MDIITHAGIGLIAAAPLAGSHPELALGIVAGSVLPDLDALSRLFGKRAFLRAHQTWTHSLPVQVIFSMLTGGVASGFGVGGSALAMGLFAGLTFHSLLDLTNTLGVTLFAPFSKKRLSLQWVFFIDATVATLTLVATCLTIWEFHRVGDVPVRWAMTFFIALATYIGGKALLRTRAGRFAPDAISLIPSALLPWRYFGVFDGPTCARLFEVNAITGLRKTLAELNIKDADYVVFLANVPEFVLMRELSPAYHVIDVRKSNGDELVVCRDLRTRNFATTFGDLEVLLDPERRVKRVEFHV